MRDVIDVNLVLEFEQIRNLITVERALINQI